MSASRLRRISAHDVAPAMAGVGTAYVWAVQSVIAGVKVQTDQRFVQPESRLPGSNPAKLRGMSDAPTQVAPGVHRLGNALVNCYLIEDGNRMTLVDGGFPGFRAQLEAYLRSRGRSVRDIDAVILTHAHSDHVGMVEGVRTDAPAPVHVHEKDAHMATTGKQHKRDGSLLPYLRHPAVYKLFLAGGRNGAARTPKVGEVTTFDGAGDLDVPGRPRIVPIPGHSPG